MEQGFITTEINRSCHFPTVETFRRNWHFLSINWSILVSIRLFC